MNKTATNALKSFFSYFIVALTAFLIYFPALKYGLTLLDDASFINDSALSYEMSENVLLEAFATNVLFDNESTPFYRPVLSFSFAAENKIAGESVFFAHLTNILLHCLSSVLVLFFFRKYLKLSFPLSVFGALIFALHPTGIQTVAWIPGRNDSLYFICFIMSFMFFLEYLKNNKIGLFPLSYLFFMLACFTKESGILIPFLFVLYYILADKKKTKIPVYVYILWLAGIIVFLQVKKLILPDITLSFSLIKNINSSNFEFLLDHISAIVFFRSPVTSVVTKPVLFSGLAACLILLFFTFYGKTKKEAKKSLFYLVLIFAFLLPNFIGGKLFFQGNRIYIPLFGAVVLFFSFINSYLKKHPSKKTQKNTYLALSFVLIVSASSVLRNSHYFADGLSFWGKLKEDTNSKYVVYEKFYTIALIQEGLYAEALAEISHTAKRTKYNDDEVIYLLAYVQFISGNAEETERLLGILKENNRLRSKGILTDIHILYTGLGKKEDAQEILHRIFQYNNISGDRFEKELAKAQKNINKHKNAGAALTGSAG